MDTKAYTLTGEHPNGLVRIQYVTGDTYTGQFKDDEYNGMGVLDQRGTTGVVYIGEFSNGSKHGCGCEQESESSTSEYCWYYYGTKADDRY
jgi:hypothetical protein